MGSSESGGWEQRHLDMSNEGQKSSSEGKVVSLVGRQPEINGDRLGDLLSNVKQAASKRLIQLSAQLFERTDDALFDIAEKSDNNQQQTQYFDGMREIRKKRQLVERLFQDQINRNFQAFAQKKPFKSLTSEPTGLAEGGLSLVQNDELEEVLAISNMVSKAENRLSRHLFALMQRLTVLNGGTKVENETNPIAPAQVCNAFKSAATEFEIPLNVRLIVYKLFDKHVLSGLDQIYDEVNGQLIEAGVLPQLKGTISVPRRAPSIQGPPGVAPGAGMNTNSPMGAGPEQGYGEAYVGESVDPMQAEIYQSIQGLLAQRRGAPLAGPLPGAAGHGHAAGGYGGGAGPIIGTTELLSALTVLQSELIAAQSQALRMPQAPVEAGSAGQVKDELVEQIKKLTENAKGAKVAGADEDTIDLVGMLFEFILQDRNLPAPIQALLSRLQIPYLKVAILDKRLFASRSHPARRLLDELAQAGLTWTEEGDKERKLYGALAAIVESVLRDFDDDMGIFDRKLIELHDFMAGFRKRAEVAEQRAADATRGRERLQTARRRAADEIMKRLGDHDVPELIRNVLTKPWANVLVLTQLRQGEDTAQWTQMLKLVDDLVWSGTMAASDADRITLKGKLPEMSQTLKRGLAMVAYNDADISDLLGQLSKTYQAMFARSLAQRRARDQADPARPQPAIALPELPQSQVPLSAQVADFVEEVIEESRKEEAEAMDLLSDEECVAQVKSAKVGTWFEFKAADGTTERAKLSWISPISSKYLFVNRKGLKVGDKSIYQLANEIKHGSAVMLTESPLFERAMDAIVDKLKVPTPATSPAAAIPATLPVAGDGLELTPGSH